VNKIFTACLAMVLITGCDNSEERINKLIAENDSLRNELATTQNMLYTFQDVGSLIDSIDASRNALRVNIVEGTPYSEYTDRLKEINAYIKHSEEKIAELEKKLGKSRNKSEAFEMMILALKDELSISRDEVTALQTRVNEVMKENADLTKTVKIQETSLEDFQLQLQAKYEEVKLFEVHIKELTEKLQITEANAFFAQAQALEAAAKKTRLAPRKKKETYQEAVELYKKALAAKHPQAEAKIKALAKKI
jgi:chromosome segregation ATPase